MIRKSGYRFSEKHALGLRPGGSCSNKTIEGDDDSKKSHHALVQFCEQFARDRETVDGGGHAAIDRDLHQDLASPLSSVFWSMTSPLAICRGNLGGCHRLVTPSCYAGFGWDTVRERVPHCRQCAKVK